MRFSLLVIAMVLGGCVTRQTLPPPHTPSAPEAKVVTSTPLTPTVPTNNERNIIVYIEKVFPQKSWKNAKGEAEYWYPKDQPDIVNGFANIQGRGEILLNYYLFLGDKQNLLVKETGGCGPACDLRLYFYRFEKDASQFREVQFKDVIDQQTQNRLTHELINCFDYKKRDKSIRKAANGQTVPVDMCFRYFQFPQKGKELNIYKTKSDTIKKGDEFRIDKRLSWNGENFVFTKEYKRTPWQKF
ncbi:MAG: hypothetical protein K2Q26_02345 [Bdellovibrionales bacterium]|nr:hypothetical protein [Bdellovibrionales bacterium]